jgi:dTMP kinase
MASINDLATAASAVSALAPTTSTAPPTGDAEPQAPQPTAQTEDVSMTDDTGSNPVRGALIILEGLDRSGKTTQVKLLEQRFVELGKKVKVMRFPGMLFLYSLTSAVVDVSEAISLNCNWMPPVNWMLHHLIAIMS